MRDNFEVGKVKHSLLYRFNKAPITLLFMHGLGDSSENYRELLDDISPAYNGIAVDFLGYGESQCAADYTDYSFKTNLEILERHLTRLEEKGIELGDIVLVGHSMGGVLAALSCTEKSALQKRIIAFVNVEGNLTDYDTFISKPAALSSNFAEWFKGFKTTIAPTFDNPGHYLEALGVCAPEAFQQNAKELYNECTIDVTEADRREGFSCSIGKLYTSLNLPKCYLYGDTTNKGSMDFIKEKADSLNPVHLTMSPPSHWLMFYPDFLKTLTSFVESVAETKKEEAAPRPGK